MREKTSRQRLAQLLKKNGFILESLMVQIQLTFLRHMEADASNKNERNGQGLD